MSEVINNNWSPPNSAWAWTAEQTGCAQCSCTTETWGSSAAPLWQKCTGGRCCWNGWAPLSSFWHPSLLSCGTSLKAAWSTDSGAKARWCGGGSQTSCSWHHTIRNSVTQNNIPDARSSFTYWCNMTFLTIFLENEIKLTPFDWKNINLCWLIPFLYREHGVIPNENTDPFSILISL